jgi:ketosteroid isomerase-like protein
MRAIATSFAIYRSKVPAIWHDGHPFAVQEFLGEKATMENTDSQEARNLAVVRRGFEAFAAGDMEAMKTIVAPNGHWHEPPNNLFGGDFSGQQAILEYFSRLARETSGTMKATPLAMAAAGDRVFVLNHLSAKRGDKTLESDTVDVFTLADGVVIDTVVFSGDQPALAAFFS